MSETQFVDRVTLSGTRRTSDGYLMVDARCARTGCQTYLRSELGLDGAGTVTVYRPEEAVFDTESLKTFAGKPVTVGHPPEMVSADNWKQYAVGDVGNEIARDGQYVKVPFRLMDASAIAAVEGGTREISMGYRTPIKIGDGTAPDGTPYQATQTGPIKINHLAIVPKARGGDQLRIGDDAQAWGAVPRETYRADKQMEGRMPDLIKKMVDGLSVETTDAGAQAIDKLLSQISDMKTAATDNQAKFDKDLATKDAKIEALEKQILTPEALDARVSERASLIADAEKVAPDVKPDGLTDADLRRAVVVAQLGDAKMKDQSDAYIQARFDALVESAGGTPHDPLRKALGDAAKNGSKPVADERDKYLDRTSSAWKGSK